MKNIEKIVVECCQDALKENNKDFTIDKNSDLTREIGFDSLGMVSLVLLLEEKLELDLDDYLQQIRECHTVESLIGVLLNIVQ